MDVLNLCHVGVAYVAQKSFTRIVSDFESLRLELKFVGELEPPIDGGNCIQTRWLQLGSIVKSVMWHNTMRCEGEGDAIRKKHLSKHDSIAGVANKLPPSQHCPIMQATIR